MDKLAQQFKTPGEDSQSQTLEVPKGIPKELGGGLSGAGNNVIQTGLNILMLLVAFLTVIVLMYSGVQWVTSSGDSEKIVAAKKRIMYAIIGLVVASLAFLIVRTVLTVVGGDPELLKNPAKIIQNSPQPATSAKP